MKIKNRSIAFFIYSLLTIGLSYAQVGINTTAPNTTLDVNGSVSHREGALINITATTTNNLSLGANPYSLHRISGLVNDFNITGIIPANASDGQIVTLENTIDATMSLVHDSSSSTAENRFYCPGEKDFKIYGKYATVTLQYNTNQDRWIIINYADNRYGDNIQFVKGTTDATTTSGTFSDLPEMSISFTPKHSTIFVSFSMSGAYSVFPTVPIHSWALCQIVNVTAGNTIEGNTISLATDYDSDDIAGESVGSAYSMAFSMFPVSVTPGIVNTIKIQWARGGTGPTTLENKVVTDTGFSHRSFTIFD